MTSQLDRLIESQILAEWQIADNRCRLILRERPKWLPKSLHYWLLKKLLVIESLYKVGS